MGDPVLKRRLRAAPASSPDKRRLRRSHRVERGVNRTDKNPLATLKARKRRGRGLRERSLPTPSAPLGNPADGSRLTIWVAELHQQVEHRDRRRRAIGARGDRRLDMADRRMLERAGDQVIS